MRQKIVDPAPAAPLITPLSFCHHRKHPEIRSQNCVFQQPVSTAAGGLCITAKFNPHVRVGSCVTRIAGPNGDAQLYER
jgi:hypothetical protein